LEVESLA